MSRTNVLTWAAPLVLFQIYLALVAMLFFFGPWPWVLERPLALAGYLTLANLAIAVGYLLSWPQVRTTPETPPSERTARGLRWLWIAALVSLAMAVPSSLARTGLPLPDVWGGITAPGVTYTSGLQRLEGGNPYILVEYLRMLLSPILVALLPLTIVFWKEAGLRLRIAATVAILFYLAIYVGRGQNKGLFDTVILLPFLVFLARPQVLEMLRGRRAVVAGVAGLAAVAAALAFFGRTQHGRIGAWINGSYPYGQFHLTPDADHWLFSQLPDSLRIVGESLARYLGQGYQFIALTLDTAHQSTLGVGHSMFLARNFDRLLGTNFFTTASLPAIGEQEFGWPMYGLWHSIYPWIASDVSYEGAIVVIGLCGYLLGLAWGKSLRTLDPAWTAFLTLMLVLFFYIPANNQIFQSGETTVAFVLLLAFIAARGLWRRYASAPATGLRRT